MPCYFLDSSGICEDQVRSDAGYKRYMTNDVDSGLLEVEVLPSPKATPASPQAASRLFEEEAQHTKGWDERTRTGVVIDGPQCSPVVHVRLEA